MKNLNILLSFLIIFLMSVSCDSDIKRAAKNMNDNSFDAYLKNEEKESIRTSDSVRSLITEYAKKLPIEISNNLTIIGIDTISIKSHVWAKVYLKSNDASITEIDSIISNNEPFKGWLKYGNYRRNVELQCYQIKSNDTIRISTIPKRNY